MGCEHPWGGRHGTWHDDAARRGRRGGTRDAGRERAGAQPLPPGVVAPRRAGHAPRRPGPPPHDRAARAAGDAPGRPGAFLVADGVLVAVQGFVHRKQVGSAWWLAQAGVNVVFGVVVALWRTSAPRRCTTSSPSGCSSSASRRSRGGGARAQPRPRLGVDARRRDRVGALQILLVTRPLDAFDVLRLVTVVFALYAFVSGAIHVVSGFAVRAVARELADLRAQAVAAGVVVTGGSVLGAAAVHLAWPAVGRGRGACRAHDHRSGGSASDPSATSGLAPSSPPRTARRRPVPSRTSSAPTRRTARRRVVPARAGRTAASAPERRVGAAGRERSAARPVTAGRAVRQGRASRGGADSTPGARVP